MTDPTPFHVSFVCSGNICRSPYAEALLRGAIEEHGLADRLTTSSLGTLEIEGQPAHDLTLRIASERGLNLISFRSRGIREDRVEEVDLLVGLAPIHVETLLARFPDLRPERVWLYTAPGRAELPEGDSGIPDPIGTGEEEYRAALSAMDEAFPALWEAIRRLSG